MATIEKDIQGAFREHGIHFSAIAEITATRGKSKSNGTHAYEQEYDESVAKMKNLVSKDTMGSSMGKVVHGNIQHAVRVVGLIR